MKQRTVRSLKLEGAPGSQIYVDSSTKCTKAHPENGLSYLRQSSKGLHPHDDAELWAGAMISLAECKPGDKVFLDSGVDASGPHLWPLYEVIS